MAHCCASRDVRFMLVSPKPSRASSQTLLRTEPELLARHFTEAGLIEKAAGLWGKAGQRSLERSALVEASEQFKRGLDQIAALAGTPTLRSQQIKLQVGLANALYHTKGFAAAETKASIWSSPRDDRACGGTRRARRRPACALLDPLRLLHGEVHPLRRRGGVRACAPIPRARRAAKSDSTCYDRASPLGYDLACLWASPPKGSSISIKLQPFTSLLRIVRSRRILAMMLVRRL